MRIKGKLPPPTGGYKISDRAQRRTPKIGPAVKVESAPDSEEEQTNEQKDEAAA